MALATLAVMQQSGRYPSRCGHGADTANRSFMTQSVTSPPSIAALRNWWIETFLMAQAHSRRGDIWWAIRGRLRTVLRRRRRRRRRNGEAESDRHDDFGSDQPRVRGRLRNRHRLSHSGRADTSAVARRSRQKEKIEALKHRPPRGGRRNYAPTHCSGRIDDRVILYWRT